MFRIGSAVGFAVGFDRRVADRAPWFTGPVASNARIAGTTRRGLSQDGYILDIGYTAGFHPETAPRRLAFAALAAGRAPRPALRPGRVFELGMGQGFGLALLAAANPEVAFEGCDFNPDHVAQARRVLSDAALENIVVSETSFAAAALAPGTRDCDVILAHGVLSWVTPEVRQDIARFVDRRLRADGLFYVSYNAPPAWAPVAPIRDLILAVKRHVGGGSAHQLSTALGWLQHLRRSNAPFFAANPAAARHLDAMLAMDPAYLAHEYLAAAARPLSFAEVVELLDPAGLAYAASAGLVENFDALAVPAAALSLLAQANDPVLRETLRDFAVNRFFRRDIFTRSAGISTPDERRRALAAFRFALGVPRAGLGLDFQGPAGRLTGRADLYEPLADRLALGPVDFDELLDLPAFCTEAPDRLIECLSLLIDSQQAYPVAASRTIDAAPARRFNRMVIEAARHGRVYGWLASPVTGTGHPVNDFDLLALAAILDGTALEPARLAHRGLAIVAALGRRPVRDGVPIETDAEAVAFLIEPVRRVIEEDLPIWHSLEIM